MEIAWIEDFLALAACMNFSRAAERRNVTQPAFSRRIRALEAWVGPALFDRDTHRLALTPAGAAFLPVAEDLMQRLARGRAEAREAAAGETATLRFLATHALSLTFFPAWLRTLEPLIAPSAIQLTADTMQACERLMLEGQGQFLLCHHHSAAFTRLEGAEFRALLLGADLILPVTGRDPAGAPLHLLPGTPAAPVPHLAFGSQSGMGRIIAAAGGPPAVLRPVFTSHLAIALKALALDGRGVAWCPLSLVAEDLAPGGRLVRAGPPDWDIPIEIRLVRPASRMAPAAEAFWDVAQRMRAG